MFTITILTFKILFKLFLSVFRSTNRPKRLMKKPHRFETTSSKEEVKTKNLNILMKKNKEKSFSYFTEYSQYYQ